MKLVYPLTFKIKDMVIDEDCIVGFYFNSKWIEIYNINKNFYQCTWVDGSCPDSILLNREDLLDKMKERTYFI